MDILFAITKFNENELNKHKIVNCKTKKELVKENLNNAHPQSCFILGLHFYTLNIVRYLQKHTRIKEKRNFKKSLENKL